MTQVLAHYCLAMHRCFLHVHFVERVQVPRPPSRTPQAGPPKVATDDTPVSNLRESSNSELEIRLTLMNASLKTSRRCQHVSDIECSFRAANCCKLRSIRNLQLEIFSRVPGLPM